MFDQGVTADIGRTPRFARALSTRRSDRSTSASLSSPARTAFGMSRYSFLSAQARSVPAFTASATASTLLRVSLWPAVPARIAENIDVRRPEVQAEIAAPIPSALRLIVFGAAFSRDDRPFGLDQCSVPGRRHTDRLGKDGRLAGARDAVQRFVPVSV